MLGKIGGMLGFAAVECGLGSPDLLAAVSRLGWSTAPAHAAVSDSATHAQPSSLSHHPPITPSKQHSLLSGGRRAIAWPKSLRTPCCASCWQEGLDPLCSGFEDSVQSRCMTVKDCGQLPAAITLLRVAEGAIAALGGFSMILVVLGLPATLASYAILVAAIAGILGSGAAFFVKHRAWRLGWVFIAVALVSYLVGVVYFASAWVMFLPALLFLIAALLDQFAVAGIMLLHPPAAIVLSDQGE